MMDKDDSTLMPDTLKRVLSAELLDAHRMAAYFATQEPLPGTIWRSIPPEDSPGKPGVLMLIVDVEHDEQSSEREVYSVAGIREGVDSATNFDVVVGSQHTGLDFTALVCSADLFPVGRKGLSTCVGKLSEVVAEQVLHFCRTNCLGLDNDASTGLEVVYDHATGTPLLKEGLLVRGIAVTGPEDPRAQRIRNRIIARQYLLQTVPQEEDFWDMDDLQEDNVVEIFRWKDVSESSDTIETTPRNSVMELAANTAGDDMEPMSGENLAMYVSREFVGDLEILSDMADNAYVHYEKGGDYSSLVVGETTFSLSHPDDFPEIYRIEGISIHEFLSLVYTGVEIHLKQ